MLGAVGSAGIVLWFTYSLLSSFFQYVVFEIVLFTVLSLGLWVMSFRDFPRNRKARRVLIISIFILPSIVAAIILVAINEKNENDAAQIFLALLAIIFALPTVFDYILRDNLDLMPTMYNNAIQIDEKNVIPKFYYRDKYALASIRNFNKEDVSVALLGIFTKGQYKELKKKSNNNWQHLYYFIVSGSRDACKLYLNNNGSLNYEIISAHGVSKPRKVEFKDIKLNLVNDEQEFYLVHIDVYYKLYFVKFMIIND